MLSPAVYFLCSENSTENPWKGLAWRPAMNPSTMNLARRSSRATWRMTSGFRYFSAVLATGQSSLPSSRPGPSGEDVRDRDLEARQQGGHIDVARAQDSFLVAALGVPQDGDPLLGYVNDD